MELQFQQKPISYLRCVQRKCGTQEESAEIIVPDRLPDVNEILKADARVCMREKECRQGSATVNGGICAVALYAGETTDAPQKVETYLPFTVRVDHSDISESSNILFSADVCAVEATVVNSRKVRLSVTVRYCLSIYTPATEDLFSCEEKPDGFQVKETSYALCLPTAYAERSFTVTDGLILPAQDVPVSSVFFVRVSAEITENRIAGNKAVFKGVVNCSASYLTEDGRYCTLPLQIPFSQFCELPEMYDDTAILTSTVTISDCNWETVSNPSSLEISVFLTVQCLVSKRVLITVAEDAYCLNCGFEAQRNQYAFDTQLDLQTQTDAVRALLEAEAREVLDATVFLSAPTVQRENDLALIRVPSTAEVLYRDENDRLQRGRLDYESAFSCDVNDGAALETEVALCSGISAVPTASGIDIRYSVCLTCAPTATWTQSAIVGGEITESSMAENRPQLIAKRVDGRQELWDIAKQYNTTVDRIRSVNGLDTSWYADGFLLIATEGK